MRTGAFGFLMKHISELIPETLEEIRERIKQRNYELYGRLCGDCGTPLDDITDNACARCARLNKYDLFAINRQIVVIPSGKGKRLADLVLKI